jgi:hypothetical protein
MADGDFEDRTAGGPAVSRFMGVVNADAQMPTAIPGVNGLAGGGCAGESAGAGNGNALGGDNLDHTGFGDFG